MVSAAVGMNEYDCVIIIIIIIIKKYQATGWSVSYTGVR